VEPCADSTEVVIRERAAFIKGLEHVIEFDKWLRDMPYSKWLLLKVPDADSEELFEIFLTEKYGNEQAQEKQA
jgi:hypothetical protein